MVCHDNESAARADRDLERRVVDYLLGRKMTPLRRIDVQADQGTVTLRGQVLSFFQKQVCLSCCHVAGVVDLIDQVNIIGTVKLVRSAG